MNVEVTFDFIKWVVSGIILVSSAIGTVMVRKILTHIKNQAAHRESTVIFSTEITSKTATISDKIDTVTVALDSLQILMEAHFEVNSLALFICNNQGQCTAVNDALLTLFKAKPSEMLGLGWLNFIHPNDKDRVASTWQQAVEFKNTSLRDHYRVIDKDLYENKGQIKELVSINYKTIFKYDSNNKLKIAVGSVWEVDKFETSEKMLECIAEFFAAAKGTPTWEKLQSEMKNK